MLQRIIRHGVVFVGTAFVLSAYAVGTTGCTTDCTVTADIYEPFRQAVSNPAGFDEWLADHAGFYTSAADACLLATVDRQQALADKEYDRCDELFTIGDDLWRGCVNESAIPLENSAIWLNAIGRAARGETRFDATTAGQQIIDIQQSDPASWASLTTQLFNNFGDQFHKAMTCQRCNKSFLGIDL